ncbi:hypothetical protein MTO96_042180 [Rhipicephalus appendiculatus]
MARHREWDALRERRLHSATSNIEDLSTWNDQLLADLEAVTVSVPTTENYPAIDSRLAHLTRRRHSQRAPQHPPPLTKPRPSQAAWLAVLRRDPPHLPNLRHHRRFTGPTGYGGHLKGSTGLVRRTAVRPSQEHGQARQLVDLPYPTADNQALKMPSTIVVERMEASAEIFDRQGWGTAMGSQRQKTPPSMELAAGTGEHKNHPKGLRGQKESIDATPGGNRFQATPPIQKPDQGNHQTERRIGHSQSRDRSAGESRHHDRQDHRLTDTEGHDLPQEDAKHHRCFYAAPK